MSLATTDEQTKQIIDEAEAIRTGQKLPTPEPPSPGEGTTGEAGSASESASPAPAPIDPGPMLPLGMALVDHGFCLFFGPGSEMQGPLRAEAEKSLGAIIVKHAPLLQKVGPEGAFISALFMHGVGCYATRQWIAAQSRVSSGEEEAEKPPSSSTSEPGTGA